MLFVIFVLDYINFFFGIEDEGYVFKCIVFHGSLMLYYDSVPRTPCSCVLFEMTYRIFVFINFSSGIINI